MIEATFIITEIDHHATTVKLPFLPESGDQIFLGDFVTEKEEIEIMKKANDIHLDSLMVSHKCWFRDKFGAPYVFIYLREI